ncbi:stage II sporulation protein M [Alkalihalobacillus sp. AL-G]|uniref:stage II sporulation protein M n=1 Tax=Alkalihalobacillus sp. AL-G TaxID=2926399 RepID=UPI00272BCC41|nr:stage II sporulation protein M [Alkalihalobacillus sp. AL-G]WLD91903.1 stage II sporulation protein M [Alkalihalobacillus sp. AL-G]
MERGITFSMKRSFSQHLQEHSSLYTFTIVLMMMGIIFGAIIVNSLSSMQKEDLFHYLGRFFGQVSEGEVASSSAMFTQSFFHYLKYIGLIWILGLSIIGLPVILVLLFLKGMVVGFTVGFLVNQMGWQGFLLSFVSVLPQNLILIPSFIFVTTAAVAISMTLIKGQFSNRITIPLMPLIGRYTLTVMMIMIIVAGASFIEAFISPVLIKATLGLFG